MTTIPIYDTLLLPDVVFYFKKEIIDSWDIKELITGEVVLFVYLKDDIPLPVIEAGDIYPIGVSARVENIDGEGNIRIRTLDRVDLSNIQMDGDMIVADASIRPENDDIPLDEKKVRFEKLKSSFLEFVQDYQWGLWARSLILQWKSINELASSMANYFDITWEEKYSIVETDSVMMRYNLIEAAAYEFVEMAKVHNEAEDAQVEEHEKLYRESAFGESRWVGNN